MTFLCVYPTLFTSLLMQERTTSNPHVRWADLKPKSPLGNNHTAVDEHTISDVLGRTRGYELCGLIRHCIPRICQQSLEQLIGAQHGSHASIDMSSEAVDAVDADMYDEESSSSSGEEEEEEDEDGVDKENDGEVDDEKGDCAQDEEEVKESNGKAAARDDRRSRLKRAAPDTGSDENDNNMDVEDEEEEKVGYRAGAAGDNRNPTQRSVSHGTGSGTESEADEEVFQGFTAGSFVSSLAFQVNKFAVHHSGVSVDSQRRYEQIRETARKYGAQASGGRRDNERLMMSNVGQQAAALQVSSRLLLDKALDAYEFDYLATEKVEAVRTALAQWTLATQQDNLTVAHIDPKYRGLGQPIQLRRIILDHFFVPDHLHVTELHDTLRGAVQQISSAIQKQLFRPALDQLGFSPAILRSHEYKELVDRVCALTVGDAVAVEWDRLMSEENYGKRQKLTSLSEDRVLLMMKQIAIEHVDSWLKGNYPSWSRLLQAGTNKKSKSKRAVVENRRQQVIDLVAADIPDLISGCVDRLMADIRARVRNQLTQFFDQRFLPAARKVKGRPSIFDSALRSFLQQAREYEGKKQPHLRKLADVLLRRLRHWHRHAERQVAVMNRCKAASMGEELLSTIQRQWDDSVAMIGSEQEGDEQHQATLDAELREIITSTHGRLPCHGSRRSKIPLKAATTTAAQLQERWQQAQTAPLVMDLTAAVMDVNAQMREAGEKLGIDIHHCPPTSFITDGQPLNSTGMLRAVALAWLYGTEVKMLKDDPDAVWAQVNDVVNFLYVKCRHVLLRRLVASNDPDNFAEHFSQHYDCKAQSAADRLKDRTLPPSPYLLQLLATAIRCNIVVWDRHNIVAEQLVQVLSPSFHRSAAPKDVVPYLHLTFLPCKLQHNGSSSSAASAAQRSFVLVPALRTKKQVRVSSAVKVERVRDRPEECAAARATASCCRLYGGHPTRIHTGRAHPSIATSQTTLTC